MSAPTFTIRRGVPDDDAAISALAGATFPLACPPHTPPADIAEHIATELTPQRFRHQLLTDGTVFYVVEDEGHLIGYAMLIRASPLPADTPATIPMEIQRIYVAADQHGSGVADALMDRCLHHARTHGYDVVWLGTNEANQRAVSFYRRKGFRVVGSREFTVGSSIECDFVLARPVDDWAATFDET